MRYNLAHRLYLLRYKIRNILYRLVYMGLILVIAIVIYLIGYRAGRYNTAIQNTFRIIYDSGRLEGFNDGFAEGRKKERSELLQTF